jgi:hypothetical protein
MVFVLRDCAEGFILPGEWQHPAFANSFGIKAFATNHVRRFGMSNNHRGRGKLSEATWNYEMANRTFTKTIGPSDYTVEVCGRGKYCARHKLEDNTCCTSTSFLLHLPSRDRLSLTALVPPCRHFPPRLQWRQVGPHRVRQHRSRPVLRLVQQTRVLWPGPGLEGQGG